MLQQLDLPAERRLGNVKLLGGAGEVALPRHGHEIAELAEFQSDRERGLIPDDATIIARLRELERLRT